MLKDGSPAPDARFETAEGPASIKDYAGRKLVLYLAGQLINVLPIVVCTLDSPTIPLCFLKQAV